MKWVCLSLILVFVSADPLSDALLGLTFKNQGTTLSTDKFTNLKHRCSYLEPEIPTSMPGYQWGQGGECDYLFKLGGNPGTCHTVERMNNTDRPGLDMGQVALASADPDACEAACCAEPSCLAWVLAAHNPSSGSVCKAGQPCCYLKGGVPAPKSDPICMSGVIAGRGTTQTPSVGMRSAVPMGGIGGGITELRGDGSFHEFTLMNQSPAGAVKIPTFDDMFTAVRVDGTAKAIRTHPPANVTGVSGLKYQGAHPLSRLDVMDKDFAVDVSLFAFSRYRVGDMNASGVPAINFVFTISNPTSKPVSVDVMGTLPFAVQPQTARSFGAELAGPSTTVTSADDCMAACDRTSTCASWMFQTNGNCSMMTNVPLNQVDSSATSGIKSSWTTPDTCLTLVLPGKWPSSGDFSLCSVQADHFNVGTAASADALFSSFSASGAPPSGTTGALGAVSASTTVAPGETVSVALVLGYYTPNFDYVGDNYGRFYSNLVSSSNEAAVLAGTTLLEDVQAIDALHDAFLESTLPDWLTDFNLQSLSHIRSAMWINDGRFRQWEAYDCADTDSIHNDGERHVPYLVAFPDSIINKLHAWSKFQQADGMLTEQLTPFGPQIKPGLDTPDIPGRIMSDVSSMFVQYVWELYALGNRTDVATTFYPTVVKAIHWAISTTTTNGVPYKLQTTYDVLGLQIYPAVTYNSFFHMLMMKAGGRLAEAMGDAATADACAKSFALVQQMTDKLLWIDNGKDAWWGGYNNGTRAYGMMGDALYAQVLAFSSGLGLLSSSAEKMLSHNQAVLDFNWTPYGFQIFSDPEHNVPRFPNTGGDIWQMANPNWAALELWLGSDVDRALNGSESTIHMWRDVLHDNWNIAGIMGGPENASPGMPTITSHYGYAFTSWHVLFGLTGQTAFLPGGTLTFAPKVPAPYTVPVLLASAVGQLSATVSGSKTTYSIQLTSGTLSLSLNHLAVGSSVHPGPAMLTVGGPAVTWTA